MAKQIQAEEELELHKFKQQEELEQQTYDEMREERHQLNRRMEEEKATQLSEEFNKLQTRLNNEMRQQAEIEFKQQMQGLQPSKQTYQNAVSNNYQSMRYEDHEVAELPICWRSGKVGHMKKDCTKALYCTNYGKNNHITSCCGQPFKDIADRWHIEKKSGHINNGIIQGNEMWRKSNQHQHTGQEHQP